MNAQLKALYFDTIKKELRNKTLLFALIFSTASIFIGYSILKLFMQFGVTNQGNNELAVNTAVVIMFRYLNIWGMIISVFFGVSAVRSDLHNNIIYQYLSLPISRTQYFVTRILGTWSMVFAFYLFSYIFTYLMFFTLFKTVSVSFGQVLNIFLMAPYTLTYVTITYFISLYLNRLGSFITMLFISGVITYSNSLFSVLPYNQYFSDMTLNKFLNFLIYLFVPHLGNISQIGTSYLMNNSVELNLIFESLHFILSFSLIVYFLNNQMRKKDL